MSNETFTFCYRQNYYHRYWKCEMGYESIAAIDKRLKEIKQKDSDIITTFFSFNEYTPKIWQKTKIQWNLSRIEIPEVDIHEK